MRAQRVMVHQLLSDLFSERLVQPASDIDGLKFRVLALVIACKLRAFTLQVGMFGVGLGVHGYVFTGSHRHGPGYQAGDTSDQYICMSRMRGCNPEQQARSRKDAVVRA